jgi:hypothetical protein
VSLYIADEHVILFEETKETINDHHCSARHRPRVSRRGARCAGVAAGKSLCATFFVYVERAKKGNAARHPAWCDRWRAILVSANRAPVCALPIPPRGRGAIDICAMRFAGDNHSSVVLSSASGHSRHAQDGGYAPFSHPFPFFSFLKTRIQAEFVTFMSRDLARVSDDS